MEPDKEVVEDVVENEDHEQDAPEYSEEEKLALEEGWAPKDKWKGAEDEWVPAKAFLKYGKVESELKRVRSEASQKEKVIKTMKDYYLNVKEDAKKEILDNFKRQKREAIKNEDYAEVAKLDQQIDDLTDSLDRKFKQHDQHMLNAEQVAQTPPPEFFDWNKRNSWYVLGEQSGLTKEADVLAVSYAQMNPGVKYGEVLKFVEDTIKAKHPDKFQSDTRRPRASDVNDPPEFTGDTKNKRAVRLRPEEKAAADEFGISYEEYAAGLKQWDKMKGVE
jgi:hypothetical protein